MSADERRDRVSHVISVLTVLRRWRPFSGGFADFSRNVSVEGNLRSPQDIESAIRFYLLHTFTLLIFGFTPFLKVIGYMPMEFPMLGRWGDIGFYLLRVGLYIYVALRWMPSFVTRLLSRNVPFIYATFIFFVPLLVANFVLFHSLMPRGLTFWQEAQRLLMIIGFSFFCHLIVMKIVHSGVVPRLGHDPSLVPYFKPVPRPLAAAPSAVLIDPSLSGEVISLHAQNQYVLVRTDQGETLVRVTLRAAIAALPASSGVQIHRSWWISASEIARATFDRAALTLKVEGETTYPVGKTHADSVASRASRQVEAAFSHQKP